MGDDSKDNSENNATNEKALVSDTPDSDPRESSGDSDGSNSEDDE